MDGQLDRHVNRWMDGWLDKMDKNSKRMVTRWMDVWMNGGQLKRQT